MNAAPLIQRTQRAWAYGIAYARPVHVAGEHISDAANEPEPQRNEFIFEGAQYTLAEMLAVNVDECEDLRDWLRTARIGDIWPALSEVQCVCARSAS